MASFIPGYEYDIFISYHQKDNKADKWVSKFVDALKTELEATFKEDVSVYFDENPHDRQQETHNVDIAWRACRLPYNPIPLKLEFRLPHFIIKRSFILLQLSSVRGA